MTKTMMEERLADALHASAARVRDDRLRPLPALEPAGDRENGRVKRRSRAWLAPAAAAASVMLIIGIAVALTGAPRQAGRGAPGTTSGAMPGLPEYYALLTLGFQGQGVQLHSTSTGSVVATAPFPKARGWSLLLDTVAASPDARTFYIAYTASPTAKPSASVLNQIWIYRLAIGGPRPATPLIKLNGTAAVNNGGSMAVSPDGTKLALTADTTPQLNPDTRGWADKIIVLDLRTGARSVWQGGLYRPGKTFTIPDISWTADGRSLVFLGLWCDCPAGATLCAGTSGQQGYRDTQVRSLSVGAGGGTLDRGALLLTQSARYPVIAAAIAGPGTAELTLVVLSGQPGREGSWSRVAIERVSAVNGGLLGVEYRSAAARGRWRATDIAIAVDPSGRYQLFYDGSGLVFNGTGPRSGWVSQGRLRSLPLERPQPDLPIVAW
jgi:hypothetical protein